MPNSFSRLRHNPDKFSSGKLIKIKFFLCLANSLANDLPKPCLAPVITANKLLIDNKNKLIAAKLERRVVINALTYPSEQLFGICCKCSIISVLKVLIYNFERFFLYSLGVYVVIFLNVVLNAVFELNPDS